MKPIRTFVSAALLIVCAWSCSDPGQSADLSVTYVANCGFLIESGGRKVVIDGLLDRFETPYYRLPDRATVDKMRRAEPPFDDLDLILFTHAHTDHFEAGVAAGNMVNNRNAILVGPPQVEEKLKGTDSYSTIKDRLRIIPAPADTVAEINLVGVRIRALPSEHSPYWDVDSVTGEESNRHAQVQHLEYVVSVGDRVMYHCGDASLNDLHRYRLLGFGDTTIDLAMVDWWDARETLSLNQKLIRDVIRPEAVIMMHMFPERPPHGEPDKDTLVAPRVILPDSLMQRWTIP